MIVFAQKNGDLRSILIPMQHNKLLFVALFFLHFFTYTNEVQNAGTFPLSILQGPAYNTTGFKKENFDAHTLTGIYFLINYKREKYISMIPNPAFLGYKSKAPRLQFYQNLSHAPIPPRIKKDKPLKIIKPLPTLAQEPAIEPTLIIQQEPTYEIEKKIARYIRESDLERAQSFIVEIPSFNNSRIHETQYHTTLTHEKIILDLLNQHTIDTSWQDIYGATLFYLACEKGMVRVAEYLLKLASQQNVSLIEIPRDNGKFPGAWLNEKLHDLNQNYAKNKDLITTYLSMQQLIYTAS